MRFDRGVQFFKSGAHDMALVEFRRAYELVPNYRVLYNIGQTCFLLRDYACALQSFERYLADGGTEVPPDRKSSVSSEITSLRSFVARLEIQTEPDAVIEVDDVAVGRTPLREPLLLNPGKRRVVVSKPGFRSATRVIMLASSDRTSMQIGLEPLTASMPSAPVAAVSVQPPSEQSQPSSGDLLWLGWTAAGLFACGAVATGILAVDASRDLRDARETYPGSRSALDDAHARVNQWSIAADVLTGATILTAGVTLYFTVKKPSTRRTETPGTAQIGLTPSGVRLVGAF
jgi:hypothetical protein